MNTNIHPNRVYPRISPWFWGFLFAAVFFRAFPYGLAYYPVLDDNNMYGVFSMMRIGEVFRTYPDFFHTRPFAVLFDVLFVSRLWSVPWLVQGVMAALQCLTLWLLHHCGRLLDNPLGAMGLVFLALNPFGMEATWWIAASSRLVTGSFLTILSVWLLLPLIGRREALPTKHPAFRGILFALVHLLSLGFYEQYLVLSVFLSFSVILLYARTGRQRFWLVMPLVNAMIMGAYYQANANSGNVAERGGLIQNGYWLHTVDTLKGVSRKLLDAQALMIEKTAVAGFRYTIEPQWIWLVLVPVLSFGIVWSVVAKKESVPLDVGLGFRKLAAGLLLTVVPLIPFFLLKDNYMAHRVFYPSLLGLAFLLDVPAQFLLQRRGWRWVGATALGALCVVFLLGGISEVRDYRAVSESDTRIAKGFVEVYRTEQAQTAPLIYLFNTKPRYPKMAFPHVSNATAADWAFLGLIHGTKTGLSIQLTTPVADGGRVPDGIDLTLDFLVGIDESLRVVALVAAPAQEDGTVQLLEKSSGVIFGHMQKEETRWVFHRN